MKLSGRMSDVIKAMDATYSRDEKNETRCGYGTAHDDGGTGRTSREGRKGTDKIPTRIEGDPEKYPVH